MTSESTFKNIIPPYHVLEAAVNFQYIFEAWDHCPICDILYCDIILLYIDFLTILFSFIRACKTRAIVTCFY